MQIPTLPTRLWIFALPIALTIVFTGGMLVAGQTTVPLSKDAALRQAHAFFGSSAEVSQSALSTSEPQSVVFEDSTTPFLDKYASGRSTWRVVVTYADSQVVDGRPVQRTYPMEVVLDSLDGHLLRIQCDLKELDPEEDVIPDADFAERQMIASREEYVGFPQDPPAIGFAAALRACMYNPFAARQIVGQYVLLNKDNRVRHPVWVVTLWGLPPIEPTGGEADWIPVYQLNHIRQVVDATTGRLLFASTHPNAPLTPEIKARVFGRDSTDN